MSGDLLDLYRKMALARAFELAVADLWQRGLIAGEMHLATGEEAVVAGVVGQLRDGDSLALDHRPTAALAVRGVDLTLMLGELLGRGDGLCRGWGGHMHLFSEPHLSGSSGIVGAAAPMGAGFALAARSLRPGSVAVAMFGDGAMNQGMVLETLNLATVWRLPLVLVCKDNGWAITTRTSSVTAGDPADRARAVGMPVERVDGHDVALVHQAAGRAIDRGRGNKGPTLLWATCPRLDGHLLGDQLVSVARNPLRDGRALLGKTVTAAVSGRGGGLLARAASMARMTRVLSQARKERRDGSDDPLSVARRTLRDRRETTEQIDSEVAAVVARAVEAALDERGQEVSDGR